MKLQGIFNSQDITSYAREHTQLFAYVTKAMAQPATMAHLFMRATVTRGAAPLLSA